MGSTPDMYRGIIEQVNDLCDGVEDMLNGRTKKGFLRLAHVQERKTAVCNLSEAIGALKFAIKGLKKDSRKRKKYINKCKRAEELRKDLLKNLQQH